MGMLKIVEWKDNSTNTIVYKYEYNIKKDFIAKGSKVIVRDSQVCVFADKGRMADVFEPGTYTMDTDNIPLLTKLMSWKYGFESPFKSDVYFVNTKQFPNNKWGTSNPIIVRDKDFGMVRVRCFGTYTFRVKDAYIFMKELSGTRSSYRTEDITGWLRSLVVTGTADAIGESKIPLLDMAGNLLELSEIVRKAMEEKMEAVGVELTAFNIENFSMPENLEKALDKQIELGMMRQNIDVYTQMSQAEALKEAAKNPGMAGSTMGAGIGLGMGVGMGQTFNQMASQNVQQAQPKEEKMKCPHCGKEIKAGSKFCPECGKPTGNVCPKCGATVSEGAKFCPECGTSLKLTCPKCGHELKNGTKFCPECGTKIE